MIVTWLSLVQCLTKKKDWIIKFPQPDAMKNPIPIPEDDINHYNGDVTRAEGVPNLIEQVNKDGEVPCFYVTWKDIAGNPRVSFGHTAMFRLAYEKTIGEHIPDNLKDKSIVDIAEAIFGNEKSFSGRVFFEDVFLGEGQTDVLMGESRPKILSSPKPTTFQHYLEQSSDDPKQLNHYNTNAPIRGNKYYWHKSGNNWKETDLEAIQKHESQYMKINPVKPGTRFLGRIRFENLSKVELGALLFSLDLPEGCYHKIGMGKPLGLGSIKTTPKLYLSNRKERYTNLFSEWKDGLIESNRIGEIKVAFEKYVLGEIGESNRGTLWNTERLQELRIMLDYNVGIELESQGETRYMQITGQNEFKYRSILPKPSILKPYKVTEERPGIPEITHIKKIEIEDLWNK
jgi:CRISPR-associated protein (TIGR03986 family)